MVIVVVVVVVGSSILIFMRAYSCACIVIPRYSSLNAKSRAVLFLIDSLLRPFALISSNSESFLISLELDEN